MCKVCAQCALFLWFYNDSWCEAVLGPSGHQGPILCTFFNGLIILGSPNRNIAGILYENATFSWKVLGCHFLCFCRCQNYKDLLLQIICQNAPKLNLVTLAPFGSSREGSLGSLLFMAGFGMFFIVLAGVQIMTIFSYSLYAKMLQTRFGDPGVFGSFWGALFVASCGCVPGVVWAWPPIESYSRCGVSQVPYRIILSLRSKPRSLENRILAVV